MPMSKANTYRPEIEGLRALVVLQRGPDRFAAACDVVLGRPWNALPED